MVSSRGSIMAGMRPSKRIPMRASNDGTVWQTHTQISEEWNEASADLPIESSGVKADPWQRGVGVLRLTLTPVNSLHAHTKSGDKPETISTLVKRLFMTEGLSLTGKQRGNHNSLLLMVQEGRNVKNKTCNTTEAARVCEVISVGY